MEKPEQVEDEVVSDENCPHHVTWKVSIFKELFQDYMSNVNLKYGLCTLVFDGYNSISTK